MTQKQFWFIVAIVEAILFSVLIWVVLSAQLTPEYTNADDGISTTSNIFKVVAVWAQVHMLLQISLVLNQKGDLPMKWQIVDYVSSLLPIFTVIATKVTYASWHGKRQWWDSFESAIFWIILIATVCDFIYMFNAYWKREERKRAAIMALRTGAPAAAHAAPPAQPAAAPRPAPVRPAPVVTPAAAPAAAPTPAAATAPPTHT